MKLQTENINTKKLLAVIGGIVAAIAAVTGIALLIKKLVDRKTAKTEYIECDGVCNECDEACDAKLYLDNDEASENSDLVEQVTQQ